MDPVNSWAGEPEVTLVSEDGTEVKVHRIFLALYTDQWRQTLQGLQISQLVLLLQDVDGGELEEIVSGIYRPFIVRGDTKDIQDSQAVEKENTIEATAEDDGESHVEGVDLVNVGDDTVDNMDDTEEVICLDDDNDHQTLLESPDELASNEYTEDETKDEQITDNLENLTEDDDIDEDCKLRISSDITHNHEGNDKDITISSFKEDNEEDGNREDVDKSEEDKGNDLKNNQDDSASESKVSDISSSIKEQVQSRIKKYVKDGETYYACNVCGYESSGSFVRYHVESKHLGIKYPCNQCDKVCNTYSSLRAHLKNAHGTQKYVRRSKMKNQIDSQESNFSHSIKEQVRSMTKMYIKDGRTCYACNVCGYESKGKSKDIRRFVGYHVEMVHLGIKYPCNQCDKVCNTYSNFRAHLKNAHGTQKYVRGIKVKNHQSISTSEEIPNKKSFENEDQIQSKESSISHSIKEQVHNEDGVKEDVDKSVESKHLGINYPCDQCDKVCNTYSNLRTHLKNAHGTQKYVRRSKMKNQIESQESNISHSIKEQVRSMTKMYIKDGRTCYACNVCGYESTTKNKKLKKNFLRRHIENKHLGVKYPCDQCDKVCNTDVTLRAHKINSHGEKKSVTISRCEYCDYTSDRKLVVIRHTNTVHLNMKPYECELCDNKYTTIRQLKSHIRSVHEKKTDLCDICFKHVKRLRDHKAAQHKEKKCKYCSDTFLGSYNLYSHWEKAHGIVKEKELLKCPSCDYTTKNKNHLRQHDQTNHNITYIYCDQCEFKTKLKNLFKKHLKEKHDNSFEKYKCDVCDYQCIRRDYLKRHKESVHEKVRYPCDQCGYQATRMQYLEKHIQTIHKQ